MEVQVYRGQKSTNYEYSILQCFTVPPYPLQRCRHSHRPVPCQLWKKRHTYIYRHTDCCAHPLSVWTYISLYHDLLWEPPQQAQLRTQALSLEQGGLFLLLAFFHYQDHHHQWPLVADTVPHGLENWTEICVETHCYKYICTTALYMKYNVIYATKNIHHWECMIITFHS